jgi:hypothetical protein
MSEAGFSQLPATNNYYLKRSLLKLVGAEFFIYDGPDHLAYLAHKKGFKWKAEIDVYPDQTKTNPVFHIRARQIVDFSAAYDVIDAATQQRIAVFKRKGWKSLLRDEWEVCGPNEEPIGVLMEDSTFGRTLIHSLTTLTSSSRAVSIIDWP